MQRSGTNSRRGIVALLATLIAAGAAACQATGAGAPDLSVADAEATLRVDDGPVVATVSSRNALKTDMRNVLGSASDEFLYARVDRDRDTVSYYVYVTLARRTTDWPTPHRAVFGTPAQTVPVERIDGTVSCADADSDAGRDCLRIETGVFEVPAAELAAAAESATPVWPFTIQNRSSYDLDTFLPTNEIRAVLARAAALAGE